MKKRKFFSYLLMGLLTLGSTAMVTSCKDYDDDINQNTEEINNLRTQLTTLQNALTQAQNDATAAHAQFATTASVNALATEVASLAKASDLQSAVNDLTTLINSKVDKSEYNAKVAEIEAAIDAIDPQLNELKSSISDLDGAYKAADTNLQNQIDVLNTWKAQIDANQSKLANAEEVAAAINTLNTSLDSLKNAAASASDVAALKEQMTEANKKVDALSSQINILTVLIKKQLTSLVFKPAYMWNGIETAEVPAVNASKYYHLVASTDNNVQGLISEAQGTDVNTPTDKTLWTTVKKSNGKDDDTKAINGYGEVSYYYNPATADLSDYNFSFLTNQPAVLTRANTFSVKPVSAIKDDKNTYVKDGVLKVRFTTNATDLTRVFTNYKNNNASKKEELPMIALNASQGDSIPVASDWALVLPNTYKDLILADDDAAVGGVSSSDNQLFKALVASSNTKKLLGGVGVAHEVPYTGSINLKDYIVVKATPVLEAGETASSTVVTSLDESTVEALGLSLKFNPIEYETTVGQSDTRQTVHVTVSEDGVVTPRLVENGVGKDGQAATRAAVDKEPIVRVTLVDGDGNIFAYGYEKLKITDQKTVNDKYSFTFNSVLYGNCADSETSLTWDQVETTLYNDLNMSKAQFESIYPSIDANQYVKLADGTFQTVNDYNKDIVNSNAYKALNNNDKRTAYLLANCAYQYGSVSKATDVNSATELLKWTIEGGNNAANWAALSQTGDAYVGEKYFKNGGQWDLKNKGLINATTGLLTQPIETYVKLAAKDNTGQPDLYVKLTIPAGGIKLAVATLGKKVARAWHTADATVQANGANEELRANVTVPSGASNSWTSPSDFTFNILKVGFQNSKLQLDITNQASSDPDDAFDHLTSYLDGATFELMAPTNAKQRKDFFGDNSTVGDAKMYWSVMGVSGTEYVVRRVDAKTYKIVGIYNATTKSYDAITSGQENLVTASGTQNSLLTYGMGKQALDILNYASHTALKSNETFTAFIHVNPNATTCYDPLNASDYDFAVRFLRPVDMANATGEDVQDGVAGGSYINVLDYVTLTDWATNSFSAEPAFFKYYGVTVRAIVNQAVTDKGGTDQTVSTDIAADIASGKLINATTGAGLTLVEQFIIGYTPGTVDPDTEGSYQYTGTTNAYNGNVKPPYRDGGVAASGNTKSVPYYLHNAPVIFYQNNTGVTEDFHIYVPVELVYTYGKSGNTQKTYITVNVKKTQGNAKKN